MSHRHRTPRLLAALAVTGIAAGGLLATPRMAGADESHSRPGWCMRGEGQTVVIDWRWTPEPSGDEPLALVRCIQLAPGAYQYPLRGRTPPLTDPLESAGIPYEVTEGTKVVTSINGIAIPRGFSFQWATAEMSEDGPSGVWLGKSQWEPEAAMDTIVGITLTDKPSDFTKGLPVEPAHFEPGVYDNPLPPIVRPSITPTTTATATPTATATQTASTTPTATASTTATATATRSVSPSTTTTATSPPPAPTATTTATATSTPPTATAAPARTPTTSPPRPTTRPPQTYRPAPPRSQPQQPSYPPPNHPPPNYPPPNYPPPNYPPLPPVQELPPSPPADSQPPVEAAPPADPDAQGTGPAAAPPSRVWGREDVVRRSDDTAEPNAPTPWSGLAAVAGAVVVVGGLGTAFARGLQTSTPAVVEEE